MFRKAATPLTHIINAALHPSSAHGPFIHEVYNGLELPNISPILASIGLDHLRMPQIATGFSTSVYDTGHEQVIKVTNMDIVAENKGSRPLSNYVLQPIATYLLNGLYEVGVFPKLNTKDVHPSHAALLTEKLAEEGYIFDDNKLSNIGLSTNGTAYVIDPDAVIRNPDAVTDKNDTTALDAQWKDFPCRIIGSRKVLTKDSTPGWKFSEHYDYTPTLHVENYHSAPSSSTPILLA